MKKNRSIFLRILLGLIIAIFAVSCGSGTHQSASWQVVLKSAKFEKDFSVGTSKADGFVVSLNIRYIGNPAKVVLPEVYIVTSKGKKYATSITSKSDFNDKMISLLVKDGKAYDLKKGEMICGDLVSFFYDIDKSENPNELVVGDVPSFKIGSAGL